MSYDEAPIDAAEPTAPAPEVTVTVAAVPSAENDAALALPGRLAAEEAAVSAQKDLNLVAETPIVGYEHARAQLGVAAEVAEEKAAESE